MAIDEKKVKSQELKPSFHKLVMEERKRLSIGGVENVESFSDNLVLLDTTMGRLSVKGENLRKVLHR